MSDDLLICPHCGEENLPSATRCLHCGLPLEEAFAIDGLQDISDSLTADFVKDEDDSLPELFRDLHEEADSQKKAIKFDKLSAEESTADEAEQNDAEEGSQAEESTPEWLKKIRQRAKVEEDSSGDLIKKVNARDDIPQPSEPSQVDSEFEDWLRQIRLNARRDSLQPHVDEPQEPVPVEETPSWLKKLREMKETGEEPEAEEKETLPEWVKEDQVSSPSENLLAKGHPEHTQPIQLTPGATKESTQAPGNLNKVDEAGSEQAKPGKDQEEQGDNLQTIIGQVGFTPGIEDRAFLDEFEQERPETADLLLLRSQRDRANELKDMVENEGKAGVLGKQPKNPRSKFFLLVLYLLVLSVVALPLLTGFIDSKINGTMQPSSLAFFESISQLSAEDSVLVVIDYQPGSSAEMALISRPVLDHITRQEVEKTFITTYPEGVWLSSQLMSRGESQPETDTYYLPGAKIGLMNLSIDMSGSPLNGVVSAGFFKNQYDIKYDSIIILTDSFNGGRNWLELVGPFISQDASLLIVASTQEATMFLPYFDSAQLDGLLAGLNESTLYNTALDNSSSTSINKSYQAGLLIMVACFVIGIITSIGAKTRPELQEDKP